MPLMIIFNFEQDRYFAFCDLYEYSVYWLLNMIQVNDPVHIKNPPA